MFNWDDAQKRAVKNIEREIKHCEKHGMGTNTILAKERVKQLKHRMETQ